ncbi:beta-ketoacyl synthase N-terminal-like domain-containing protein [Apibacter sp. HY039]|uniref:beta-ketoacyl synthase N-terminal-like domain-containing protein n=1 Tax=Apibacter sp. HY039 TaxID=2501476 RepID=UPI000FEB822D|nr:beta-ketoacyl synthase N-terminal-like domain-containing protein [Apibacter sp. HY039]
MIPIYINGLGCISIQPTYQEGYFLEPINDYSNTSVINAVEPNYKEIIPPMQLRRMGKSIKMASYAANKAMEEAGVKNPDAIITGTGLGCQRDSEKFIESMLEDHEQSINPTPFIQSTHNMAAAAVALSIGCKNYNMTYTDGTTSFDSALLDACLYISERGEQSVLVGSVDENADKFSLFFDKAGFLKKSDQELSRLLKSQTRGTIYSEGATFSIISDKPTEKTYAKIIDVEKNYNPVNITEFISVFLNRNGREVEDIDAVMLGYNGDKEDTNSYNKVAQNLFKNNLQLGYKHVFGENDSSSAFAFWMAAQILKKQQIPQIIKLNQKDVNEVKTILIYHQKENKNHSLLLLEK